MIVRKISTINIQKQRWLSGDPGSDSLMSDIGFQLSPKDREALHTSKGEGGPFLDGGRARAKAWKLECP